MKVTSHRYRARGYRNGVPNGFAELSLGFFEEYAGSRNEWRLVFNVQRSFLKDVPFYIGAFGNFGEGEDVFGVSIVYLLQPNAFVSLFGGNVQN